MSITRTILLLATAVILSGCRTMYFGALNLSADPPKRASTSFIYDTERDLGLDVYAPDNCHSAPVLVFFYGGTWMNGKREWYRFVGEQFAARGLLVVIPDYRKAPEEPFPTFMHDAAKAVAFVRQNVESWCGNPDRIVLSGHSAGAHIAALLATDKRYLAVHGLDPKTNIAGVVGLSGPYDFRPIKSRSLRKVFADPANDAETQPITFVDGDEPPMLLFHGRDDRLVWAMNSEHLDARLRAVKVPSELVLFDELGHTAMLNTLGDDTDPHGVIARTIKFVERVGR
ncbi:MAG: alpha/beta hydrolase [Ahniella sp.]|nr:alpha/beta hydrolase [Ahniella sp.]